MTAKSRILVVRMGAMGDIVHTLPAAASLKHSLPHSDLSWLIDRKWAALLEKNPFVDQVLAVDRRSFSGVLSALREVHAGRFDTVIDFQGLIKSAFAAAAARPERIFGFHPSHLREKLAGLVYSHRIKPAKSHVVDQNLELAAAAGATNIVHLFPLPQGEPEGPLPDSNFVLAAPLAGWAAKQWPLEFYGALAGRLRNELGVPLVLNGPPSARAMLAGAGDVFVHVSGLPGLIDALRRATAVVGVDSGPLHLAAALGKPGVAIFGPTDPARNGPWGAPFTVLRSPAASTTYKRAREIDPSMRATGPDAVFEALKARVLCPA